MILGLYLELTDGNRRSPR